MSSIRESVPASVPLAGGGARASAFAQELGLVACLWKREMLRVARERSRWLGALAQPLLFWIITGTGMAKSFRIPGHEEVTAMQYFFPGMLVMIILFTTIFSTISVVEDRQQGFLQSVLVAPGSRAALVIGKVLGVTTIAAAQVALFFPLSLASGFTLAGVRWGALVAVTLIATIGLTAMNFTVAWVLNSVQAYHAIMGVVLIPMWFLSGAMFPPPGGVLGLIMRANPLTYAVDGLRAALDPHSLGVPGLPLPVVLLVLLLYAIAMIAVATAACRRKGEHPERAHRAS